VVLTTAAGAALVALKSEAGTAGAVSTAAASLSVTSMAALAVKVDAVQTAATTIEEATNFFKAMFLINNKLIRTQLSTSKD
jgi:hypothetical protein